MRGATAGHWVAAGCADACGALQGLGGVQECLNRALRMRAPQVLMNGRPLGVQFKRNSAYVAQEDCFVPTMSAWETLKFTATLTLPKVIGPRERAQRIEEVLKIMGLWRSRDTQASAPYQGPMHARALVFQQP